MNLRLENPAGGLVDQSPPTSTLGSTARGGNETETDLSRVVMESLKKLHFHLRLAKVDVRTALALDLPKVQAERGEVRQMITDLILQSARATQPGGALQVTTFKTDGRDPRLGDLPRKLADRSRLVVFEIRGLSLQSGAAVSAPAPCRQATFRACNDRFLVILNG